ncbi:MAG: hypothetical protein KDD56_03285, partial [Bdellovibrionales bacterium]|nr:hypothetical protein [Bdellovibrionales bacterium]
MKVQGDLLGRLISSIASDSKKVGGSGFQEIIKQLQEQRKASKSSKNDDAASIEITNPPVDVAPPEENAAPEVEETTEVIAPEENPDNSEIRSLAEKYVNSYEKNARDLSDDERKSLIDDVA